MDTEDPITNACRLLREAAQEMACGVSINGAPDWANEPETKAAHDEQMAAADALEALTSQDQPVGAAQWQPIETVPKDGAWIQLWREPWQEHGRMDPLVLGRWCDKAEEFIWPDGPYDPFTEYGQSNAETDIENGEYFNSADFTHWMPLPAPPAIAAKRRGAV